jgi:hypothetical protein
MCLSSRVSSCGGIGTSALLAFELHARTFRVALSSDWRTRMIFGSKSKSDTRRASTSPARSPNMAVKLGFIKYDGGLYVSDFLLSVVLHD